MSPSRPVIILIVGLPGTGKTTLAKKLQIALGCCVVTSEEILGALIGSKRIDADRDLTPQEIHAVYNILYYIVDSLVANGQSVIVDGVFRSRASRGPIIKIVKRYKAHLLGIETVCNDTTALKRLQQRKHAGTISPGGPHTYFKLKKSFDKAPIRFLRINTGPQ
jgi:predicted kinase